MYIEFYPEVERLTMMCEPSSLFRSVVLDTSSQSATGLRYASNADPNPKVLAGSEFETKN
jgi:hypothetical protein